ncbi:hypothetical protein [uncultured Clostridium sp.]|uniref:hypothetical protein n=1 Tax=uncultured Clostridium sp. TaxID=59620 RepID=UPI00262A1EEC|nr:hypothetical protein [uncultured Clostridium sp.]
MNISYFLIKQMIEDKCIRELAVLIKLKSIYSSGCVHDYSPYKLSKSCDLSRNTVKKYVDFYLSLGYARMEGTSLVFADFKKIDKSYKYGFLKIDTALSLKKIQLLLFRQKIENNQSEFNYLKTVRQDSTDPKGPNALRNHKKAIKALMKLNRKVTNLPSAEKNYSVSIKTLAKQFKCSVGKAQGIVNSLCEDGLLKRITNYSKGSWLSYRERKDKSFTKNLSINNAGCWISNGIMFKRLPNIYVL